MNSQQSGINGFLNPSGSSSSHSKLSKHSGPFTNYKNLIKNTPEDTVDRFDFGDSSSDDSLYQAKNFDLAKNRSQSFGSADKRIYGDSSSNNGSSISGFMSRANLQSKVIRDRELQIKSRKKKRVNFEVGLVEERRNSPSMRVKRGRHRQGSVLSGSRASDAFTFKDSSAMDKFGVISQVDDDDMSSFEEQEYAGLSRLTLNQRKNKFK